MEHPQFRPGRIREGSDPDPRLLALFRNSAQGNAAIQLLVQLGVPSEGIGVTPPEQIEGGQGMLLSIPCPDEAIRERVLATCRAQGALIRDQSEPIRDS